MAITKAGTGPKSPGAERKQIDWEAVEIQYRAGIRSLKDIGGEFNVSDAAIIKRARRDGWTRDLRAKIQARAEQKVSAKAVSAEVSAQTKITENLIVEANAEAIARVRLAHRTDIQRSRGIVMNLLAELEASCGPEQAEMLNQLGEMMRAPDSSGMDRLNDLYRKVVGLPGRAKTMKDLGESLRVLVDMERRAFGLDEPPAAPNAPGTLTEEQRAILDKLADGSY